MGPIEKELRAVDLTAQWWKMSYDAFVVCLGAEQRLSIRGPLSYCGLNDAAQREIDALVPDMFSEAIEAAEALGL